MRHVIARILFLVVGILLIAGPASAQKKPVDKDVDKPNDKANDAKMIRAGTLVGKVAAVYEDSRKIRLQLTLVVPKLNAGALAGIQSAQRQMLMARTVQARLQAQQAMMRSEAQLYTLDRRTEHVELMALDDVVVRTARPKEEFDEKGRPKRFTRAELKELKGPDPKEPGYKAEFSDIQTEQVIQVTLVRKKGAPAAKPVRPKKGKDKDKDEYIDVLAGNLPQISRIMILAEPPPSK
jgi:hypothetical protein